MADPSLQIESYPISPTVTVVRLTGKFDSEASDAFFKQVETIVQEQTRNVIIDCGSLEFMSSLGLAAMMRLHARMRKRGGNVKLAAVPGVIQQVMDIMHLNRVFESYESIEGAHVAFIEERR